METTTRLLLPEVRDALQNEPEQLLELIDEMHPADLADLAAELDPELQQRLVKVLPLEISARVLEALDEEKRVEVFGQIALTSMSDAISITDEMAADDRADLYAQLPEEMRKQLLDAIDAEDSYDIRQLLSYPEDSAGSLMTTEFVALSASLSINEAIEEVRRTAADMETIYQAFAVDSHGTLLGVVSLRDLVVSKGNAKLDEILNPNVVSIDVEADQEEVVRLIAKYDLLALPVVDRSHHILGIITVDDVMDVVEEEATEDVHRMGAVDPLEQPYLTTPMLQLLRKRAPWLVILFLGGLVTENVLEHYAHSGIESALVLLLFVPLIASSGGNAGSQSATLIIRAMAIGRVSFADAGRVLRREVVVGGLLGIALGLIGVGRVLATGSTRSLEMAAAIGLSVVAVVLVGSLLGSAVPLALRRIGVDPAVASTPFIASVVDITGLVIYFEIATLFLP
ncbi:MAG TPA: magnesium transporter [Kofleriaceae bacterium]|nr:magnesium transporter [Kofleriaceae bacterium]